LVAEGINTLSGGQRQRLLIARAIARSPRILLFDEATSALDNRTQAIIGVSLERLTITRIAIAHRLSTIRNADRILMLAGGKIVRSGSYDELIRSPGPFADFTEAGRVWPRMELLEGSVSLQGLLLEGTNAGFRELPLASLFATLPVAVLKARTATASKRVRHRISA